MSTRDGAVYRKRHKSESQSEPHLKQDERNKSNKDPHDRSPHKESHSQHKGDHANKSDHSHGHHSKGDHSRDHHHDGEIRHRKISTGPSHPFRPRAGTLSHKDLTHSAHHDSDKRSTGTADMFEPMVFYENTYNMQPESKFHEGNVRDIIATVLKENVTEKTYDPSKCGSKCKLLSEIIKERVKKLNMKRFKLVSVVMMGQQGDQSMIVSSRCLWDQKKDNHVSVELRRGDIIAIGIVFAVYVE